MLIKKQVLRAQKEAKRAIQYPRVEVAPVVEVKKKIKKEKKTKKKK